MFNFYVLKQEFFGDYHEMTHIWAPGSGQGYKHLTSFQDSNLQLVLCKRLTLSAASIFVIEGLFRYTYFLLFEENHQDRI